MFGWLIVAVASCPVAFLLLREGAGEVSFQVWWWLASRGQVRPRAIARLEAAPPRLAIEPRRMRLEPGQFAVAATPRGEVEAWKRATVGAS